MRKPAESHPAPSAPGPRSTWAISVWTVPILILATAGAWTPAKPPAQEWGPVVVIAHVLDGYGGKERVLSVSSFRQTGMLVARTGGGHADLIRVSLARDELRTLVKYPEHSEIRILRGDEAWRGAAPSSLRQVRGPLLGSMVLQGARTYLPRLLHDLADEVVLESTEGGRHRLVLDLAPGLRLRVFVESHTGFVTRTESILVDAPAPIGFATDYSQHRMVDGVLFAHREETFASGVHTASAVLHSIELNPPVERTRLPAGG